MMARYPLPAVLVAMAMTGCSMAPRYVAPAPPVPARFPSPSAPAAQAAPAAADLEWKDFYTDERLRKVLELAQAHNRDFKVAALNTEKARAYYRIQRSALLPQVDAVGSSARERLPASVSSTGSPMVSQVYSVSAGISSWEIDFFGRIQSLKDQALQQFLATEQSQRAALISLRAQVASAYLALAGDQEALKLAQDTLESQDSTYRMAQRSFSVGASSELDARRAQVSRDSAQVSVASYTRVVALDRSTLDFLVGAPVPQDLLPDSLSSLTPLRESFSVGLPSDVLVNRPDILMAENQLKAANANIGAARAAFFPTVSLTTNIGTMNSQLSGLFKAGSNAWTFSPQISVPIFDYGAHRANLKVSKVDREIYLAQYDKAIQSAFKEVSDAITDRDAIREQRVAQETLTQALAATYKLAQARFKAGLDGSLSELDAQRSFFAAEQNLIALRQSELNNLVTLYKVLGGGTRSRSSAADTPVDKP
jgi:multidrug efflux system outer membrane protein